MHGYPRHGEENATEEILYAHDAAGKPKGAEYGRDGAEMGGWGGAEEGREGDVAEEPVER